MKKCSKCGAEADESARFCPKCGNPLDEAPQPTGGGGRKPAQNTKMYSVLGFIPPILLILFAALSMLFFIAPVAVTPGMTILGEKIPAENSGNVYKFSELGELGVTGSAISLIIFAIILLVIAFILLVVCVNAKTRNSYFSFGNKKITVRSFLSVLGYIFVIVQFITACAMFAQISEADGGLGLIEAGAAPILILVFSLIFGVISAVCAGACVYLAKKRPELAQSAYGANAGEWLKHNKKPVIIASVIIAVVLILSIVLPVTITTVTKNKHNGTYYYYDAAADEYDRDYYIKLNGDKFTDSDGETGKVKFDGEKVTFTTEFFGIEDVAEGTIKNHVIKLGGNTYVSEKHKHEYDENVTIAATCVKAGADGEICICGKIPEESLISAGHIIDSWNNPVCTVCNTRLAEGVESNGNSYKVVPYEGKIIIPKQIGNSAVTEIGSSAFSGCTSLTSITIPDSVTYISDSAFSGCTALESIEAGAGSIKYSSQDGILYNKNKTEIVCVPTAKTSVTIPASVTEIGDYAFGNCSNLESIEVAEGNANFASRDGILYNKTFTEIIRVPQTKTTVNIPTSVTKIGRDAFEYCTLLTSITIPASVTQIGGYAFDGCDSLESIEVAEGNKNYASQGGILYNKEKTAIYIVPQCIKGSVTIPEGVTTISREFLNCTSLTSVTIPASVTYIGSQAFYYCTSLTSVTIPASVTSISVYAFGGCSSLKKVYISDLTAWCNINFSAYANPLSNGAELYLDNKVVTELIIPAGVTTIGEGAFDGCTSLTSVTIPAGVTTIGNDAFSNCTSLKKVYISDLTAWCNIDFNDYNANPLSNGAELYLDNKVVTELIIPAGVTEICDFEFSGCTSLTSVTIPEGVTKIGNHAFQDCTSLTSVNIPESVTSIGSSAFAGCKLLTSVTIPDGVTEIGKYVFRDCTSLTRIDFKGAIDEWKAIKKGDDWNYKTGNYTVYCTDGSITKRGVETRN